MNRGRRVCESIHLVTLGLWLGVLVMTGVAAAVLFPTIKALDPRLPEYAAFTGEHWSLAAGRVAATLFFVCDAVQFAGALIAGVTLGLSILLFGLPARSLATACRAGLIVIIVGVLSYQFIMLAPDMNRNLAAYWTAAKGGDNSAAATFKAAFDAKHPLARNLLAVDALLVVASFVLAAWSATGLAREQPEAAGGPERERIEEPLLASRPPLSAGGRF
ncbi:MAG: hypothetical protein ACKVU4_12940 [Phycisphaerales bacterium]